MSESFRAALREVDGEIATLDVRLGLLRSVRASLVSLVGEPSVTRPPTSGEATRATVSHAPSAAKPDLLTLHAAAAAKIVALVTRTPRVRLASLVAASGLSGSCTKRLAVALVRAGRLQTTGRSAGTRYSVPGNASAPSTEPEGDRGRRHAAWQA